jgi:hypothetical protein
MVASTSATAFGRKPGKDDHIRIGRDRLVVRGPHERPRTAAGQLQRLRLDLKDLGVPGGAARYVAPYEGFGVVLPGLLPAGGPADTHQISSGGHDRDVPLLMGEIRKQAHIRGGVLLLFQRSGAPLSGS